MKITLKKSHKNYDYVGRNPVSVCCRDCADKPCFSPHDWNYRRTDGKFVHDFRCNTREHNGCPDWVEK